MFYSLGDLAIDLVWTFDALRPADILPTCGQFAFRTGGVAYNFADAAVEAGEPSCVIGRLGQDMMGDLLTHRLRDRGIDTRLIRDPERPTGAILITRFANSGGVIRSMSCSDGSANQDFPISDVFSLDLSFKADDVLFATGYSLFRESTCESTAQIMQLAQQSGARTVFDIVPHDLTQLGDLHDLQCSLRAAVLGRLDLCIAEYQTWNYLLFGDTRKTAEPAPEDLARVAGAAAPLARLVCVRFGFDNASQEALFLDGALIYNRDTGYSDLGSDDARIAFGPLPQIGYGERLSVSLAQQLFFGRHSWLYSGRTCTTPLEALNLLRDYVTPEATVLDVGCGTGRALDRLLAMGFTNITGVDVSLSMVRVARQRHPALRIEHKSLAELATGPFRSDIIVSLGVLTSIVNDRSLEAFVDSLSVVLAPGGILLVADFLINTDTYHVNRYDQYASLFAASAYGTFISSNGSIARHFAEAELTALLFARFEVIAFRRESFQTVNARSSNGFIALLRQPRSSS